MDGVKQKDIMFTSNINFNISLIFKIDGIWRLVGLVAIFIDIQV